MMHFRIDQINLVENDMLSITLLQTKALRAQYRERRHAAQLFCCRSGFPAGECRRDTRARSHDERAGRQALASKEKLLQSPIIQPQCIFSCESSLHEHLSVVEFPHTFEVPELAGSRVLFLDHSGNIHSMYREGQPLTGLCWDALAAVAGLAPKGPIGILGLGAGSVCQVIHHLWPERRMEGWELDPAIARAASDCMGLRSLIDSGALTAHVGDALGDTAVVEGGFAAVVVDIFMDAALLPALTEDATWQKLKERLRPDGFAMVNLGLRPPEDGDESHPSCRALNAMSKAFEGKVLMREERTEINANGYALAWQAGDAVDWGADFPEELQRFTEDWQPWKYTSGKTAVCAGIF